MTAAGLVRSQVPARFTTRFADLAPVWARLILVALLGLSAYGAVTGLTPYDTSAYDSPDPNLSDSKLYLAIVDRVAHGQGYYEAAAAEQRARGYPLKPFVTVRLPTLAHVLALLGPAGSLIALAALSLLAIGLLSVRFLHRIASVPVRYAAIALTAASFSALISDKLIVWHEIWATLLLALALALRTDRRWAASVVLAMGFVGLHAANVAAILQPGDLSSQGWAKAEGWRLPVFMIWSASVLAVLPLPLVGILVPLSLLGWLAWRDATGARIAFYLGGLALSFCAIGRINNMYWGFLFAPLLPAGLAFALPALRDLWEAAQPRPIAGPAAMEAA